VCVDITRGVRRLVYRRDGPRVGPAGGCGEESRCCVGDSGSSFSIGFPRDFGRAGAEQPPRATRGCAHLSLSMSGAESTKKPRIGVLALQGSFAEHCAHVVRAGGEAVEVRKAEQLAGCSGLIIPGGESTTMANVARRWNLFEPLRAFQANGGAVWGTCAGLIFLAERINRGEKQGGQELLGGLDVTVDRNFFGSQIDSFETSLPCDVPGDESDDPNFRAIFIRAPAILSAGEGVTVMARYDLPEAKKAELAEDAKVDSIIVAVKQGQLMATSFHPEITADNRWHKLFVEMAAKCPAYSAVDDAARAEVEKTEIGLINPGGLPVFTDSVLAGPAYGAAR
jgi:5'-phosphate synthase pdxT subunit